MISDGADRQLSIFSIKTVGRTVSSGADAECAHRGSLRGPWDARPDEPRAGGEFVMTSVDFRTDPVTARRHRVVSLVTHADQDIVWAEDETGCYEVARDAKGNRIVVERSGPIKIVRAKRCASVRGPRAIRRRFRRAAVQRAPLRSRGLSFPKVRHCTNGHGHVSPGCRPLRGVEVRRQKGDPARRHKGGAQNAARVQIRYGVIPTGAAEVICPAEGCRTE
jgi:hypothetical protein